MSKSGIYKIENTITGDCYVGSAVDFAARWRLHRWQLKNNKHHSQFLQRVFNKHGEDALVYSILEETERDKTVLFERESHWIRELKPKYNGTSVFASRLGMKMTPEEIEKVRQSQLRPDVRAKKSATLMGHEISPETRAKISQSLKGRPITEESKAALLRGSKSRTFEERSKTLTGKKRTEETKLKMAEAARNRRKPTEEERKKLSEAAKNRKYTDEGRQKRSEMMKARWAKTELTEQDHVKRSEAIRQSWASLTEEERLARVAKARTRPPVSEETRQRQSESAKHRKRNVI
jgi:group I intron endonuclease